ncbi:Vacuole effluxer Atg22 like protein [Bifidobacterium longum subsp. suis]|uniref:Vacuole effluxer Atg22 like protein n=1 Tax=Bifidobacterium longum TaxID=216816 RepID=UPI003CFDE368
MISRVPRSHYCFFLKTASIIGTFLVATTTSLTGNASLGVLPIAVLLVAALVFLLLQKDPTRANVLRHRR